MTSIQDIQHQLHQASPTQKIALYHQLLDAVPAYSSEWKDTALAALQQAQILNNPQEIIGFSLQLVDHYMHTAHYDKAMRYLERILPLAQSEHFSLIEAKIYTNMGNIFGRQSRFIQSKEMFLKAAKIIEQKGQEQDLAVIYNNLAITYSKFFHNIPKCIEYGKKSLAINEKYNNAIGIAASHNNIGIAYQEMGDYTQAFLHFDQALQLDIEENYPKLRSSIYANLGNNYRHVQNYDKSLNYLQLALNLAELTEYTWSMGNISSDIAHTYWLQGNTAQALAYAERAHRIASEIQAQGILQESCKLLAQIHEARGEYNKAYQYLWQHQSIYQELFSHENSDHLKKMISEFELAQAEKEKEIYRLKNVELVQVNHELNQAVQQLQKDEALLSELNQTKDLLFSIISHDLRNAFSVIRGNLELLIHAQGKLPKEKNEKMLSNMQQTAIKASDILCNMMRILHLQSGRIAFSPERTLLRPMIQEEIQLQLPRLENKEIDLQIDIPADQQVHYDPHFFSIIFRNLLSNAVKFTPQNGIIRIFSQTQNNKILLSIQDNGLGIPANLLQQLFEFHSHKSRKGTAGESGSGLGLVFCKQFIEKSGETISAESVEGEGTTFTISLNKF